MPLCPYAYPGVEVLTKDTSSDLEYWSGDQTSPKVHLMNDQDEEERQPIYNILGRINGAEQSEKSIIVGSHRDAWCFGASSGNAIMLEVIRVFGALRGRGWRPRRTIEFASWDAGEYNLIGSTEHVESRISDLRRDGFAYLNVNAGAIGDSFHAAGNPSFGRALGTVLDRVNDPVRNQSLQSIWREMNNRIRGLAVSSDCLAFQNMAGTSSLDLGFNGPAFPYHSCYDNFEWMARFGDPGFQYHKALAEVLALLILELSDSPILPLDNEIYATNVKGYVEDLEKYVNEKGKEKTHALDIKPLQAASKMLAQAANQFHAWDEAWREVVIGQGGFESNIMAIKRISHNTRLANFHTDLLDVDGGVSRFLLAPAWNRIGCRSTW